MFQNTITHPSLYRIYRGHWNDVPSEAKSKKYLLWAYIIEMKQNTDRKHKLGEKKSKEVENYCVCHFYTTTTATTAAFFY